MRAIKIGRQNYWSKRMRYFALSVVALTCASCAMKATPPPPQASGPRSDGPVISRVVQRHDVIVVRAGANGPTYSLESKSGAVLVSEMTLSELAASHPEMFRAIKTMEADVRWAGE
jgi:hypothetical protein